MAICRSCDGTFKSWQVYPQNYSKICPECCEATHECACGCGEMITMWKPHKGKKRFWVDSHHAIRGDRNPAKKKMTLCIVCGNKFKRTEEGKKRKKRACPSCYSEISKCVICHNEMPKYDIRGNIRITCSHECRGKNNAREWSGPDHPQWTSQSVLCSACGKTLYRKPADVKAYARLYCDMECKGKGTSLFHIGKEALNWQGGISFEPYATSFNIILKRQIRERDNHTCQICGATRGELKRELDVHHTDYDKQNSSPSNLLTVCCACNARCNFRRDYWGKMLQAYQRTRGL